MNDIRQVYAVDFPLDAETLLQLYRNGLFPMADGRYDSETYIVEPRTRGIIPIESYAPSRSLAKLMRKGKYETRRDTCFDRVVTECAGRRETWINETIIGLYGELHRMGYAHSFETFSGDELVGGLYGLAIGRAFFGESMFSRCSNASKIALCSLIDYLKDNGFMLLDTQFLTPHLATLGGIAIPQEKYLKLLHNALA